MATPVGARQQIIEYCRQSVPLSVNEVRWVPNAPLFAAAGTFPRNTGSLAMWQLGQSAITKVAEVETKSGLQCATFGFTHSAAHRHCAVGTADGHLHIVDLDRLPAAPGSGASVGSSGGTFSMARPKPLPDDALLYSVKAHNSVIVRCTGALFEGPPEVATASRDGVVRLWDPRQKDVPIAVIEPADAEKTSECWAVAIGDCSGASGRVVAAGYMHGDLKLLDLRVRRMLWEGNLGNGVCGLDFDRPDIPMNKLAASTLEGRVSMLDMRTLHPTEGYATATEKVHHGTVWGVRFLPQNREVAVSAASGEYAILRYRYPAQRTLKDPDGHERGVAGTIEQVQKVQYGSQPVVSFDLHGAKEGLMVSASIDQTIRVLIATKLDALT
eukprot:TRINITY_DN10730_c0_g1_i1.p1 TRINITY_DN10730_c0_g1~~TRINITY_DN10730_c0_g1_i1.p1  ORF type:complete len:384 (+),score=68.71 TRINITY_DN10730_c0_g1_i1:179-1330(+)